MELIKNDTKSLALQARLSAETTPPPLALCGGLRTPYLSTVLQKPSTKNSQHVLSEHLSNPKELHVAKIISEPT
jgi:hypothetical protein